MLIRKPILPSRKSLVNACFSVFPTVFLDLLRICAYNTVDCTLESFPEVTDINKQKFLAELAQLLTFMYEEDRQDALLAYSNMFDEAEDERALLQSLVSPIRQAVLVARAYNATERKLQAHSQSRGEAGAERDESVAPDYLQAIFAVRAEAMRSQAAKAEAVQEDENQFSLFDRAAEQQAAPEAPADDEPAEEEEAAPAEEPSPEEPASEEERVDAFMEDFQVQEKAAEQEEAAPAEAEADEEDEAEDDGEGFVVVMDSSDRPAEPRTVRKPRVLLLILYILFAIPITLVGIALLLIPTAASLGAAALFVSVGVMAVSSVFGGFAVLADLLVVLGAALVLLALGLLFLWLFIWFIGGAIAGLVRGICALVRKWCYKEVPAI